MKRVLWLFVIVTLCVAVVTLHHTFVHASDERAQDSQQAIGQEQNLQQIFRNHEQVRLDTSKVAAEVRRTGRLSLATPSMTFDLKLTPHDMRASNYRAIEIGDDGLERAVESGPVRTYKGKVLGRDDVEARFTIDDLSVEGSIITPDERYFIEPLRRYSPTADASDFIFYRGSDVIENSAVGCAVTMAEQLDNAMDVVALQESAATPQAEAPAATAATLRQVELATEADYEYVRALGGTAAAANSEIMSIMNQVDGVYQRELNLTFKIVYQSAWATAGDPYTATDLVGIINQFTNYWNTNRTTIHRDLAHMWTGKNVGGSGVSWQGTVCLKPANAYGVSPRVTAMPQKYIITAHEIGHSFNATHPTDTACNNTIMSTVAGPNSLLTFCTFSRNQITTFVNANNACLTAVTSTCTYSISPASASIASGGGSGRVSVTATAGCNWTAVSNAAWITITAGASGTGNGAVSYTVAANTSATSRTGTLTIAGKTFTVTQAAAASTPPVLSALRLSRSNVPGCLSLTGTVTISAAAPANGVIVTLSDNIAATRVPASVTVPAGATSKTFTITTVPVAANQVGSVTATLGAVTKSAALTVRRIGVLSVTLSPNPVVGPNPVTGTVTLECTAPTGGIIVALASSNTAVAAPTTSSLSILAGAKSKTFSVRTTNVSASSSAVIKATANSITKTKTLTVN